MNVIAIPGLDPPGKQSHAGFVATTNGETLYAALPLPFLTAAERPPIF